ncbi:MAG: ATP-binding protein, partial [Planctomycetota bacterium]|nr:ATP-binding protein [Planctomycetota bacterium]
MNDTDSSHTVFDRVLWGFAILTGSLTLLLGLLVIFGWHTGNEMLVQVLPEFVPMQYNTALGFILCGAGVLLSIFGKIWPSMIMGTLSMVVGSLTLVEYIGGISLGIDELFMEHTITVATSHPGRMAPNTATCFLLVGVALLLRPVSHDATRRRLLSVIFISLAFGLSVVALSGYFTALETAYGWGNLTRMAVHTSIGFVLVSTGLACFIWSRDTNIVLWMPRWMPIPIGLSILTATICFWQALIADNARIHQLFVNMSNVLAESEGTVLLINPETIEEQVSQDSFAFFVLLAGGLLAVAMPLVVFLAQKTTLRARDVVSSNETLRAEIKVRHETERELQAHRDSLEETVAGRTQELRRINYHSDIALELTACGYWHVDYSDPDYYYQSERAARILGEPPRPEGRYHLQDEWFTRLVEANPETAEKTAERYQGAIEGRYEHYESTYAYKRPSDGKNVWVHALGKIIRDKDGKIQFMYGVYQDVTQRIADDLELREAKHAAEHAAKANSEFLSNMSHELRTPLNGVLGYAQILQRDRGLNEKQRNSLSSIISCGQHLLTLINDVLDLSKIDAGRLEIDLVPGDLHKLLRSVFDIVRPKAESKGLAIELDVSPEVPVGIVTDHTKLKQTLLNLLGNATKFTRTGSITLKVRETEQHQLEFRVVDTGIGMTPEELEVIFDPFKQTTGGKESGGTGLGLAISHRISEALGGTLTVESEQGVGSCFTVTIPLEEAFDEDLPSAMAEALDDGYCPQLAEGQDVTILVVDDRLENREILVGLLESTGIKTVQAINGVEALQRMNEQLFPLVLMDVRMPVMNGIEATRHIREDPALKDVVVIAVTASVFPEFRNKVKESGFYDFIAKPLTATELFTKI